ncbi:uncharacterized protein LOC141601873 [Silene latifolia]|uniref:uncharacterized protein LOC141601873 n=1 Tax=Silene latifolia TaxID=37657 RepID=UPI003D77146D
MLSSFEHRQALLQALMNMTVSPHTTPNDVVSFVAQNQPRLTNAVTFSDEDLPSFGPQHCLAMYITVECRHKRLPMTLVDDGSAVNVLPLRTAFILGLEKSDFAPTTQMVRAFDGTVRRVSRLVTLSVNVGKVERKVNFQVIDVASSFNILLGRPWIHTAGAVSSTLHRKIKIPLKGEVVTINATPIIVTGGDVTSEVQTDNTALESCGFEVVNAIESTFEAPNMNLYTGSRVCKTIFKTGKYFGYSMYPRRENAFQLKSPVPKGTRYGLGYELNEEDSLRKRVSTEDRDIKMGPYSLTLNGHFVKAGEEMLSLDFPEPLFNSKANKLVPGIEVFRDCFYIPEDIMAVATIKKESIPIEDGKAMGLLFGEEKKPEIPNEVLVNMIVRSDRFDPSTLITDVDPQRNTSRWRKTMKWTDNKGSLFKMTIGEGQMFKPDDDSESESESESESDISPKAKSRVLGVEDTPSPVFSFPVPPPSAVEDRQVEEEEEEVEPPPQLVKGLEEYDQRSSVIEDTEVVNVGTTLEPQELKIGTTLDPAERKGMDPIKYLFEKPVLMGRISRWTLMLSEFDLKYVPLKAIKGKVVADFLTDNPVEETDIVDTWSFPDEDIVHIEDDVWDLYFDGASNNMGCGIGVLIISPRGEHVPVSIKLDFAVTNNAAEYEACLLGLQSANKLGVIKLTMTRGFLLGHQSSDGVMEDQK